MRADYFDWVADPGDPGTAPVDRGRESPCGGWENPGDPGDPGGNEWKPEASEPNESTAEARRGRSDRLCERLAAAIARETHTGIGHSDGAWEIVEAPSKRALDLLAEWEATGREEDWQSAVAA